MKTTMIVASSFALLALTTCTSHSQDATSNKPPRAQLETRLEVTEYERCFSIKLFLKNIAEEDTAVTIGWGGTGQEVVPYFTLGSLRITPPTYLLPPKRTMRPNKLAIPAGKEILYGTYTLGYPPHRHLRKPEIRGSIRFEETEHSVATPAVPIKLPTMSNENEK